MIKKNLRTILLGVTTLLLVYLYLLSISTETSTQLIKKSSLINSNQEQDKALKYLNQLRQGAGLVPFTSAKILNQASKNHADYLITNHTYGHYEERNKSNFTGKFASDRVIHEGYNTGLIIENVSSNNRNYKESIDGLFAAIYHRFAFLDFQGDEVGIAIKQNKHNPRETAFVYNIGSSALNRLYTTDKKPSQEALTDALNRYKHINKKIITYPFDNQTDVPPVFFNEQPDPLPNHDVSGFPISISFNPVHFKIIKLLNFQLFKGEEETPLFNTLVYDQKKDPNQRLEKFTFVLFPLERLEWNQEYRVKFLAVVDKQLLEKEWRFTTRNPSIPLHRIDNEKETITVKVNEPHLFYFPPQSGKDLLHNVRYNNHFKMEFVDQNTLKLIALKASCLVNTISIGRHNLRLHIED
jgi:uncharacterized protein YkwD